MKNGLEGTGEITAVHVFDEKERKDRNSFGASLAEPQSGRLHYGEASIFIRSNGNQLRRGLGTEIPNPARSIQLLLCAQSANEPREIDFTLGYALVGRQLIPHADFDQIRLIGFSSFERIAQVILSFRMTSFRRSPQPLQRFR